MACIFGIEQSCSECGMCPAAGKRNSKVTSGQGINAEKLSRVIADFIFAEKELVLEALKSEDEQMLEDEIYEYIQNCESEGK